jgi:hypothetical protein
VRVLFWLFAFLSVLLTVIVIWLVVGLISSGSPDVLFPGLGLVVWGPLVIAFPASLAIVSLALALFFRSRLQQRP